MNSSLQPGDMHGGFNVLSVKPLSEFRSRGMYLRHKTSGCRVYHVINDDEENLFAFGFKTPPKDNTGVSHIVEHAVLSGSERFPIKDPFAELIKGSMKTFLNAMTYPDKTVYPAGSTIEQDLFNMMLVYGDAVFFPLLRREIFLQEGHRLVIDEKGKLSISGVVYNEMRGNYSSHESIVNEWAYRSLFTDSPYVFDSGGEPQSIPTLTYEDLLDFHRTYYHPSNCYIFLYGNIPTECYLDFIEDNFLSTFTMQSIDTSIPDQPRWTAPRYEEKTYPIGKDERTEGNTTICLNWLCAPITDSYTGLLLEIVEEALLGNPGNPLYKALIDSDLGEDISPSSGLDRHIKESTFTVGLRGSDPDRCHDIEKTVFSILKEVVTSGIPTDALEGALFRTEFHHRELPGGIPLGLRLMGKAYQGWIHGLEPDVTLQFAPIMEKIKKTFQARGDEVFREVISTYLLENPHRTTLIVRPDPLYYEKLDQDQEKWLKQLLIGRKTDHIRGTEEDISPTSPGTEEEDRAASTPLPSDTTEEDIEKRKATIKLDNRLLKIFQDTPDPIHELEKVPTLERDDLPREVKRIKTGVSAVGGVPLFTHDLFTNSVIYIDIGFDILDLNDEDIRFLPYFAKTLYNSGLPRLTYDQVARRLSTLTGGFGFSLEAGSTLSRSMEPRRLLFFRMKTLKETMEEAISVVRDICLETDFSHLERLKTLLLEMRNDIRASLLPHGNRYATLRAASYLSPIYSTEELWGGIEQYDFLTKHTQHLDELMLAEKLRSMKDTILNKDRLLLHITASEPELDMAVKSLSAFAEGLPKGTTNLRPHNGQAGDGSDRPTLTTGSPSAAVLRPQTSAEESQSGLRSEALIVPGSIGYGATVFPGARMGTAEYAHESVLSHLLSTGVLWQKIRMAGGAYGASASINGIEGIFSLSSYRDPNPLVSLPAFSEALKTIAEGTFEDSDVKKAIIGTVGKDSKPFGPRIEGYIGLRRRIYRVSDELRQKKRDDVLRISREDVISAAKRLLEKSRTDSVSVAMADEASVEEASDGAAPFDKITPLSL